MPSIRIRGVKSYKSKGRLYHYHRKTGLRIEVDIEAAPDLFLARVRELDAMATALPPQTSPRPRIETVGGLLDSWHGSEEWRSLKPQTRASYERVIDPVSGAFATVRGRPVAQFTPPFIVGLRDVLAKRRKRWLANYSVKVLRIAFNWGRLHGWCHANPAQGVPLPPAPPDAPKRNTAWSAEEFALVEGAASPQLRRVLLLGYYAGLRVGDIISVTWDCWDGERLTVRQSKTGDTVSVRATGPCEKSRKRLIAKPPMYWSTPKVLCTPVTACKAISGRS